MHFSLPFTGAKFSAYFYLDIMIASLLYIIPMPVSQSLFAEGSYSETELKMQLKKAIKVIYITIIPDYYPCNYYNFSIWKLYFVGIRDRIF
jgi:hypothetical protein